MRYGECDLIVTCMNWKKIAVQVNVETEWIDVQNLPLAWDDGKNCSDAVQLFSTT
jgi:hypothetical protein